jgi:hypothetical protein
MQYIFCKVGTEFLNVILLKSGLLYNKGEPITITFEILILNNAEYQDCYHPEYDTVYYGRYIPKLYVGTCSIHLESLM